ncbi:MAG: hypothetical protein U0R19_20595 [Bryobacteraceae bacterium]
MSYEAVLIITTYIFRETKHLSAEQSARLRQWFWRASFGERYKVGGENFVSRDLEIVAGYVLAGHGEVEQFGAVPQPTEWSKTQFKSNVARSRAFILALAAAAPRNLPNGMNVDVQHALSSYNKKEYHHVFPRAYLKAIGEGDSANVLGNIVMLTSASNKAISDNPPSKYVPPLSASLGSNCDAVFRSNLLPTPSDFDYRKAPYTDFLAERGKLLTAHVTKLILG